jgi:hypothetical protein
LTYKQVLDVVKGSAITLKAQKSSARNVKLAPQLVEAIKKLQEEKGADKN